MATVNINNSIQIQALIQNQIAELEHAKDDAVKVMRIALQILGFGFGLTVTFYISPIIPLAAAVLVLIAISFFAAPVGHHGTNLLGELLFLGFHGTVAWGKAIYTAQVAIYVGLANAGIAACALIVAVAGVASYCFRQYQILKLETYISHGFIPTAELTAIQSKNYTLFTVKDTCRIALPF